MGNRARLISYLKNGWSNWDDVRRSFGDRRCVILGFEWTGVNFCSISHHSVNDSDVFSKPKKEVGKERLIKELKDNFKDWGMVCSHFSRGDMFWGFEWCNDNFRSFSKGVVTESDVFSKPKKCEKRSEFLGFLKTFEDWNHVEKLMSLYHDGLWGWELVDGYVRRQGHGVITESDVFFKPICTDIVKQFKPNYPIDNNLPEIIRTTSSDVLVPCSTKWVSGL